MDKPLAGVRVLELARILAGPWAGQLLADLGAEVIKVERPGTGDETRHWGPPFVTGADGEELGAAYFHACNRGKKSLAVDLATEAGQEQVRALSAGSDVLIENFKVGSLVRHRLDFASLAALNPALIYCSITGFGQTGPYAARPGYDFIIQAMGGAMSLTGAAEGEPQKAGIAYADLFTGLYATVAILAALHERGRSGQGAHIDMALLDCQVAVLANQALNWMASGENPPRMGNAHTNLAPYQLFTLADGEMVIAVGSDPQFERLCTIIGLPGLAADPRFRTNPGRVVNRSLLLPQLEARLATLRCADLESALEAAGIPAGRINKISEVFADPHVAGRGLQLDLGGVPGLGSPIVIDGKRQVADQPSPPLPSAADS